MPPALHPGAIQGKEGIRFCHLATLRPFPVMPRRGQAQTNLFLELVEFGDVVEEGGDDGGEEEELFGREVLERVHDGEVSLDRHRPEEHMQGNLELLY